jgi:pyridinium-3,5-bisthiocarboxylic acid mononucleotide nickel chelatase
MKQGLHLHVDAASGAAGDMMLGALIDLGVPVDAIGDALDAIGAGRGRLHVARVIKGGIAAVDVKVDTEGHVIAGHEHHAHGHDHDHTHGHHHYGAIRERIAAAKLTGGTRTRALDIFDRLARAEAKLHGSTVEQVTFHEVGAIDSIVDVVGTAAALDYLAPSAVTCASVAMGHGFVRSAHGILPVPAPAALEVLREAGGVMADGGLPRELCTPTGAAILAATVTSWTPAPAGRAIAVGWGAGDIDLADRPNALRVVALEPAAAAAASVVWQIDANIDDMSAELCAPAAEAVFAAGALDVWWTPVTMKKGRPALVLSALAEAATRDAVIAAILRETTTIGENRATDFTGFTALAGVAGNVTITANQNLTSFAGFSSFTHIDGSLTVTHNPVLLQSVAQAWASGITISGSVTID